MTTQANQGLGRRQFLLLTSSSAVATIALGKDLVPTLAKSFDTGRSYSIGFVEADGLKAVDAADAAAPLVANVVSADTVGSPDGAFLSRDVRLSVSASHIGSSSAERSVEMLALYTFGHGTSASQQMPYGVWSYSKKKNVARDSGPVRFRIPVDETQRVRLVLKRSGEAPTADAEGVSRRGVFGLAQSPAADNGSVQEIELAVHSGRGATKLRRGYYIVAPLAAGQDAPRWDRMQLRKEKGLVLVDGSGLDETPADFDYVVLFFDYADAAGTPPSREELPAVSAN